MYTYNCASLCSRKQSFSTLCSLILIEENVSCQIQEPETDKAAASPRQHTPRSNQQQGWRCIPSRPTPLCSVSQRNVGARTPRAAPRDSLTRLLHLLTRSSKLTFANHHTLAHLQFLRSLALHGPSHLWFDLICHTHIPYTHTCAHSIESPHPQVS